MTKYRNVPTAGYASGREARLARSLELCRAANDPAERVVDIQKQVRYELIPPQRDADGKLVERKCEYLADFVATFADGQVVVYDAKGFKTRDYVIKRKLMLHVHGIRIREV